MYLPTCATELDAGACRGTVQEREARWLWLESLEVHQEPLSWALSAHRDVAWVGVQDA
jgi:hypothetical protein